MFVLAASISLLLMILETTLAATFLLLWAAVSIEHRGWISLWRAVCGATLIWMLVGAVLGPIMAHLR